MFAKIFTALFGTTHERHVKKIRPLIAEIEQFGEDLKSWDDAQLAASTESLRARLAKGETLDDLLVDAFAICREACDRRLGMLNAVKPEYGFDLAQFGEFQSEAQRAQSELAAGKPEWEIHLPAGYYAKLRELYPESVRPYRMRAFDVQLIGGVVLHQGRIAEMATGEGKTLAAACPVYLNALSGKGVHVVTVNDYLARRDAETMGKAYKFLGLTVGIIIPQLEADVRRISYGSDITYGTNNEFGFDYLRDNMAIERDQLVQRELNFCIVDEVDSILIDEARTPLIISGPAEESTEKYLKANSLARILKVDVHFTIDEKSSAIHMTEDGVTTCENFLNVNNLYADGTSGWVHHINQALKAHHLFKRDDEYVVEKGQEGDEVVIIDENTGRKMVGRRYSDGLHQAIEAKEGLKVRRETQTLASITFQNYFRLYNKLSGMTGTADTEATEFDKIYSLGVTAIPTHRPVVRDDRDDQIFLTRAEKLEAIVADIKERHAKGQPLLIGTVSIEKSEELSAILDREGVQHAVLNAKNHANEAEIIAYAGYQGRVTIATNMAGRGTDIVLGPGVPEVGGLHVLGTERHESRRIDNQLRGRAGRQGDPGSSQYYLSLEDDLMRIFGGDRMKAMMERFGAKPGEVISHPLVNRAIANAQKRVEGQNFEARKYLLEYDDVANAQRKVIYRNRRRILEGEDMKDDVCNLIEDAADIRLSQLIEPGSFSENWDLEQLETEIERSFDIKMGLAHREDIQNLTDQVLLEELTAALHQKHEELDTLADKQELRALERRIWLMSTDHHWKEHLLGMDHLRDAIRFQGYAQKDPLTVYKKEAFEIFGKCQESIALAVAERLMHVRVNGPANQDSGDSSSSEDDLGPQSSLENDLERIESDLLGEHLADQEAVAVHDESPSAETAERVFIPFGNRQVPIVSEREPGRNDPCPCGSGKKFKKCCGA